MLDPGAAPLAPLRRVVRLVVAYDGAAFHGFAENPGVETVAGALRTAIATVLRRPEIELTGAGRTDAGVHAWGQVISFDADDTIDLERLQRGVNAMCGPAVVVRSAEFTADGFNARFSAIWRRYRYTVLNTPMPNPFLARTAWHVGHPLSLDALRLACDPFIGEHDFSAFCKRPKAPDDAEPVSLVRRVLEAHWSSGDDGVLRFEIRANAFCHNMVRSIVGTMIDVGRGRRTAGELTSVIRSGDRGQAGPVAPPHGLCLWEVGYP